MSTWLTSFALSDDVTVTLLKETTHKIQTLLRDLGKEVVLFLQVQQILVSCLQICVVQLSL